MASFDYDAQTDVAAVSSVADAIRDSHRLVPLTEEQKLQRRLEIEAWQEEQAFLAAESRLERERQQDEAEAIARHEAALEIQEANRKARLERLERDRERQRDNQIAELSFRARQSELWQSSVQHAVR
jgi:hypothetical protein